MQDRVIELIHGEIDGTNSEQESAELRDLLARDPASRELYADLTRLAGLLDGIEPVEPPAELRGAVLAALGPQTGARRELRSGRAGWWERLRRERPFRVAVVRHAAVLAAGIVLGVVATLVGSTGLEPTPDLSGTLAPRPAAEGTEERWSLDEEGLRGSVWVRHSGPRVFVSLELEAVDPVQVVLGYDAEAIDWVGLTQTGDSLAALETHGGRVTLTAPRDHRYTVLLDRKKKVETKVQLQIVGPGGRTESRSLLLPPAS